MAKLKVPRHQVVQPDHDKFRLIPLTRNQNAIVSISDYEEISKHKWFARKEGRGNVFYAGRRKGDKIVKMAREILACSEDEFVDHKNRNTLDNRRENLRVCTKFQNQCNRAAQANNKSGYKGVCWYANRKLWIAQIAAKGRHINLGLYEKPEHAAIAYNVAAMLLHGDFAVLNSP